MLLAGYGYAHFLTTRFPVRVQTIVHLVLLLSTLAALPLGLSTGHAAPWQADPFVWLLQALLMAVALPFFTISASGPLLQFWFSRTGHRSSADPYFLYAASNCGSLMGLLGYPALVEPNFQLREQSWLWTCIYIVLAALFGGCAVVTWLRGDVKGSKALPPGGLVSMDDRADRVSEVSWSRRAWWILCAFIPSSLMLAVTMYLTTDIASVPLLWVIPLGIYLVTFILVFNHRQFIPRAWLVRAFPIGAVSLVFLMLTDLKNPAWLPIVLHLTFFFLTAMVYHSLLAEDRPPPRRLTEFYFYLSVGGVLGGLLNSLVAPMIFRTVAEYPLVIVLACVFWSGPEQAAFRSDRFWRGLVWPTTICLLTAALAMAVPRLISDPRVRMAAVFGVPILSCYCLSSQARRFGLSVGAVLVSASFCYTAVHGRTLHEERNFFGSLRVTLDPEGQFHRFYHGSTLHGLQFVAPERQYEPLAYYHRTGPFGQFMRDFNAAQPAAANVAVLGLGVGTMACYAQRGQHWTFYEINPALIRLAQNTNFFTYLQCSPDAKVDFKVGDARLRLREAPTNQLDLLVCDAFGSDVPPLHLLNRDAVELYLSRLSAHGVLLFHTSSRYFDFRPVIGNLGAHFQLCSLAYYETDVTEQMQRDGKFASYWIALARHPEDFGALRHDWHWHPVKPEPAVRLWTDDYSNILGIFQWW
jgi:SAM-dependent methyltransferase